MKHMYQPDEISCGPTCLKMVYDHIKHGEITFEEIKKICGTDNIKGTTLDDMIVGLKHIGINYEYPTLSSPESAIQYLNESLFGGDVIILRTLTKGIKHWVVVTGFDGRTYEVKDPWLGEIKYSQKQIINIWAPRDWDCLRIPKEQVDKTNALNEIRILIKQILMENYNQEVIIRKFQSEDRETILKLMIESFSHLMPEEQIPGYTDSVTNYSKSIVAVRDNVVVGAYLFGDNQLSNIVEHLEAEKTKQGEEEVGAVSRDDIKIYINPEDYIHKKGIEGVALVIAKSERGSGLGSKLKDYTRTLGYDYIWGMQYKELGNLEQWLKRRKLAAETKELNITVEDFN